MPRSARSRSCFEGTSLRRESPSTTVTNVWRRVREVTRVLPPPAATSPAAS